MSGPSIGSINGLEREAVTYFLSWAPYGGPPSDETLPRFGLFDYELAERVREIAVTGLRHRLVVDDIFLLRRALVAVAMIEDSRRGSEPGR